LNRNQKGGFSIHQPIKETNENNTTEAEDDPSNICRSESSDAPIDSSDAPIESLVAPLEYLDAPIPILDGHFESLDALIEYLTATLKYMDIPPLIAPTESSGNHIDFSDAPTETLNTPVETLDAPNELSNTVVEFLSVSTEAPKKPGKRPKKKLDILDSPNILAKPKNIPVLKTPPDREMVQRDAYNHRTPPQSL
jgi:hypothetical protein